MQEGVKQENITLINLISCEIGLKNIYKVFPKIKSLTAAIDPYLLEDCGRLAPGLGDLEKRFQGF